MQEHKDKTKAKQDNSNSHAKVNLNRRMCRAKCKSTSRLNNENLLNVKSQSITNQNANSNQKQRSNSFKRFDIKITTRKSKSVKAAREDFVISNNENLTQYKSPAKKPNVKFCKVASKAEAKISPQYKSPEANCRIPNLSSKSKQVLVSNLKLNGFKLAGHIL